MRMTCHNMDVEMKNDGDVSGMEKMDQNDYDLSKLKNSMPIINSNDYDFNGFKYSSTTSRSFVRPSKALGKEHRNISVPNSLKVHFFHHFYNWHFSHFDDVANAQRKNSIFDAEIRSIIFK